MQTVIGVGQLFFMIYFSQSKEAFYQNLIESGNENLTGYMLLAHINTIPPLITVFSFLDR